MITHSEIIVKQVHVDELGHLNHVFAVQYLELARDDWYAECGLWEGRPWSADETLGTIVVNVNVNYRLECFLDEKLIVRTQPGEMGTKSYSVRQEIIKENGDIAIDGVSTNVVMDMSAHQVIPVPQSLAQFLAAKS